MGKKRRNPVTDDDILTTYAREKVVKKTAILLGIGQTTVARVLAKNGIDSSAGLLAYREGAKRFSGEVEREIRKRYEAGATVQSLVDEFGGSDYSVKRAVQRAGGTWRDNPAPDERPEEVEQVRAMYAAGLSQMKISLALGRSHSFVTRLMARHGIARRGWHRGGAEHTRWKGGEWLRQDGYACVWVAADDPLAVMRDRMGYVLKHRLVMARSLGRALDRHETVHHIDGDRQNNRLENLQLRQGRHGKGVVLRCRDCGSHNVESAPIAPGSSRPTAPGDAPGESGQPT